VIFPVSGYRPILRINFVYDTARYRVDPIPLETITRPPPRSHSADAARESDAVARRAATARIP